jgi:redox-sensitive bicupin YhaK (pirin superfamily)
MLEIRKSTDRGYANHGWLESRHSFSFAKYYDAKHMGFGPLLVINEDWVVGGKGFGTHGHQNMEIITYVLDGALEHKDSMGNTSVLRSGDVQRMTAGTGVQHSEFNHSSTELLHLLQIWIKPDVQEIEPGYEEKYFDRASKTNQLRLIASPNGRDESLTIHQDALVFAGVLHQSNPINYSIERNRIVYLHVVSGAISVNGVRLSAGDASKVIDVDTLSIDAVTDAKGVEVLLFDMKL